MMEAHVPAPRGAGVAGLDAWSRSAAEPHAAWLAPFRGDGDASVQRRVAAGIALPHVEPKFALRDDEAFFCIGPCFMRTMEERLLCRGINVRSVGIRVPVAETPHRLNGVVNKFTLGSLHHELRWSLAGDPVPDSCFVHDRNGYHDLQLAYQLVALPLDRARERREHVRRYFARLRDATAVVLALADTELWYDDLSGLTLNVAPTLAMVREHPGRFTVHPAGYNEIRAQLEAVYATIVRYARPGVKLIVIVSPNPIQRTFLAADAMTANGYGKATMRAVAGDFVRDKADAEYYPAYEALTVTGRHLAYERDELHVDYAAADAVTAHLLERFGVVVRLTHPEFREELYLKANPDVRAAVADLAFESGYEHWLRSGRAEGRPLEPR